MCRLVMGQSVGDKCLVFLVRVGMRGNLFATVTEGSPTEFDVNDKGEDYIVDRNPRRRSDRRCRRRSGESVSALFSQLDTLLDGTLITALSHHGDTAELRRYSTNIRAAR